MESTMKVYLMALLMHIVNDIHQIDPWNSHIELSNVY